MGETTLGGKLLIAMPSLADPNFFRTVILLGTHSNEEGAFGLIMNRPSEIPLVVVLEQLGITDPPVRSPSVLTGGPVQPDQGFVIVEGSSLQPGEPDLEAGNFTISGRTEFLETLALGNLERAFNLCLGYSGWSPGQLEREIEENSWLVAPATGRILFHTPFEDRWTAALRSIGVDPGTLVDLGHGEPS
ncbi:MAG: YqgE/AlgH family protein [Thermoanaerobaculales bacterium]|nr:YqgE/AlgH family protein [Thermoanaerobaculales bacterium]